MRLGGVSSSSLAPALLISAILCYRCVRSFNVPLRLLCLPSALVLQGGALLAAKRIAPPAVQLIPIVVVLSAIINAPLPLPPPPPARSQSRH